MRSDAKLARFYGASVLTLPPGQKLALQAGQRSAQAEEELRETGGANLTTEGYHALVLAATGSPVAAERATRARVAAQMRRGETPQ